MTGKIIAEKYEFLVKIKTSDIIELYLAMEIHNNRPYAIRIYPKSNIIHFDYYAKVLRTMEISHPNITQIVDVIEDETTYYIIYEYVEGETFQRVVEEHGAQSEQDVTMWAREIAYTLQYLHSLNPPIYFPDLNPRKILLCPSGQIKIVGLDDISSSEMWRNYSSFDLEIYMTPGYYAPEGLARNTSEKSDIYSLGAIMYFLVTGISPEEPPYILLPIREVNPNLSSNLDYSIEKCTASNPEDRYQNCEELLYDLEGRTGPSNLPTFWEKIRKKDFWKMVFCKK